MSKEGLIRSHPDFPWLRLDDARAVESLLMQRGLLAADERVQSCEKPGEGNMNLTIRVRTDRRSIIVKQARPWVEKYDHIPAPWNRIQFEARFYQRISSIAEVADRMPRLLGFDNDAKVLVLEDKTNAESLASLYAGASLTAEETLQLGGCLGALHDHTAGDADPRFENFEMRRLNHEHIFELPLAANNGIDLDHLAPGLAAAAHRLREDQEYCRIVKDLGDRYLASGSVLLHGDYFPGSWLRTPGGIFVIDPEFCFYGDREFDLGCAIAHLRLAQQPLECAETMWRAYATNHEGPRRHLVAGFAATEVMRRIMGVAQLPLAGNVNRVELLEQSRRAMLAQNWEKLWG